VFRSSAETLRALVPEPLMPNPHDLAFLMIGSMLTDEFGDYAESIVAVPSSLGARSGNHVVFHHVDAEKPMIAGREIMGWPKRFGEVRWSEENGRIDASTTRDGRTLIRATAEMVGPAGPEHLTLSPTWLNLKLIPSADGGSVPDVAQITDTTLLDVAVADARHGTATLEFESTADDPVGGLEVDEVIGAVHALLSFDLPGAEVVHDYLTGQTTSVPAAAGVTG
jgi:acetoacetate decarboxylase